jgi:hypothetical protein
MNRRIAFFAGLGTALVLSLLGGCLSAPPTECTQPGQILWEKGSDPAREAPKWIKGGRAAIKAAGIWSSEVPNKYLVYVGVSEDKADERGAQFNGVEDMLKRYAVWLKNRLNALLPEAAKRAKVSLPIIDTALGAYNAVIYLPRENAEYIRELWQAEGRLCPDGNPVYRVYVLGVFDRETRRAHLLEAAKETFKVAIIKAQVKEVVLEEFTKLAKKE